MLIDLIAGNAKSGSRSPIVFYNIWYYAFKSIKHYMYDETFVFTSPLNSFLEHCAISKQIQRKVLLRKIVKMQLRRGFPQTTV